MEVEKELGKTKFDLQATINSNMTFKATFCDMNILEEVQKAKIKELKRKFIDFEGAYVELMN